MGTETPHWQLSAVSPQDKKTKGHIFAHKQEFYKDHGSLKKNPVAEDHHWFQIPINYFDEYAHISFYAKGEALLNQKGESYASGL